MGSVFNSGYVVPQPLENEPGMDVNANSAFPYQLEEDDLCRKGFWRLDFSGTHTHSCVHVAVCMCLYIQCKNIHWALDDGLCDTGMFLGADDTGMNERISSGPLHTYVHTKHHFRIDFHSCDLI